MKTTDPPVTVTEIFLTSSKKVWGALTDPDEMVQWFFENIPDFKAEVGFKTEFPVVSEGRTFTHTWTVLEVVPGKKITYNWTYPEYPGDANVTFELTAIPEGAQLDFSMEILEDFPDEIPEFRRESCEAGWDYFLRGQLKNYLEPASI